VGRDAAAESGRPTGGERQGRESDGQAAPRNPARGWLDQSPTHRQYPGARRQRSKRVAILWTRSWKRLSPLRRQRGVSRNPRRPRAPRRVRVGFQATLLPGVRQGNARGHVLGEPYAHVCDGFVLLITEA